MQQYKKLSGPSKNYNVPKDTLKVFFHEKKLVQDFRKTRDTFLPDVIVRLYMEMAENNPLITKAKQLL